MPPTLTRSRSPSAGKGFQIQAAGKVLSSTNAESIKTGLLEIHQGARTISQVLKKAGVTEEDFLESEHKNSEDIEASSFTDSVAQHSWRNRFRNTLDGFWISYLDLNRLPLDKFKTIETEAQRSQAITDEIEEFQALLAQCCVDRPPPREIEYGCDLMEMSSIEASSLSERIAIRSWVDALSIAINIFQDQFLYTCLTPLQHLNQIDDENDRVQVLQSLIEEVGALLKQHATEVPVALKAGEAMSIYAQGQPELADSLELDFSLAGAVEVAETVVDAADIEIQSIQAAGNLHPIVGTLFEIDKASEMAPSVGPGVPLYIPLSVAETVLAQVKNKPLEAAASLTQHDKNKTIGVMESAEISGNEFVFHGYLWDYNHPDQVEAIATAKGLLGSSMNARAKGHMATVEGQKVYWVDELELLGGCILFNELATYRKTRIHASAHTDEQIGDRQQISASGDLPASSLPPSQGDQLQSPNPGVTDSSLSLSGALNLMDPLLQQALNGLGDKIDVMQRGFTGQFAQVESTVAGITAQVAVFEQERQVQIQARSQQDQEQVKTTNQQQLIEAIGSAVGAKLQEFETSLPTLVRQEVQAATNTRKVPARPGQTIPLLVQAGASATDPATTAIDIELGQIDYALNEMRSAGSSPTDRIKLVERARGLRAQQA